jgi:putative radical SAM enzyme (TIGR03279 family)
VTLFGEVDWQELPGGTIVSVIPGSLAAEIGLQSGDQLLAINDHAVADVIDVQYHAADESLELLIRRGDDYLLFEAERSYDQQLGLEFTHPTFDIDIRRCNNLCEFCFVLQMPGKFRRTLYIKDDDYRYSFLFGHYVTLTNLDDHDWQRIESMRLSPLYVSVHSTDIELRRRFLRNNQAPDIMDQLRWLAKRGLTVHTQLVIVPGFNDGEWLDRSIADLATLWPAVQTISVVPVGLTKHHKYGMRPHTPDESTSMLDYLTRLQREFQGQVGARFVYPTDEWYLVAGRAVPELDAYDGQQLHENGLGLVRRFLDEFEALKKEIDLHQEAQLQFERLVLVTGALFARILEPIGHEFAEATGCVVEVKAVSNTRLGESITAAGLLMAADIVEQLRQFSTAELFVLPRVVFDHPDLISLDNYGPQWVADQLARPVALADVMGDVWEACTGRSSLLFHPQVDGTTS